jgi:hypothetical protein
MPSTTVVEGGTVRTLAEGATVSIILSTDYVKKPTGSIGEGNDTDCPGKHWTVAVDGSQEAEILRTNVVNHALAESKFPDWLITLFKHDLALEVAD